MQYLNPSNKTSVSTYDFYDWFISSDDSLVCIISYHNFLFDSENDKHPLDVKLILKSQIEPDIISNAKRLGDEFTISAYTDVIDSKNGIDNSVTYSVSINTIQQSVTLKFIGEGDIENRNPTITEEELNGITWYVNP